MSDFSSEVVAYSVSSDVDEDSRCCYCNDNDDFFTKCYCERRGLTPQYRKCSCFVMASQPKVDPKKMNYTFYKWSWYHQPVADVDALIETISCMGWIEEDSLQPHVTFTLTGSSMDSDYQKELEGITNDWLPIGFDYKGVVGKNKCIEYGKYRVLNALKAPSPETKEECPHVKPRKKKKAPTQQQQ